MKSFLTRLISGIVLVLLVLVTCWVGSLPLFAFVVVIGFVGLSEYYRVFDIRNCTIGRVGNLGAYLWYVLMVASVEGNVFRTGTETKWLALLIAFMLLMAVYVFTFPKYDTLQIMAAFFGIVYIPVMLSFIYLTRMLENGFHLVWLIFLCSWGCDTCAYCVGMLIGKHKMAPVLSPKKSIEGAIGGVVGAALLGAVYAVLTKETILIYTVICAVGAGASQVGDLAASAVKRQHNIKDYGNLIPGHGGILDRFDSVIVTAPMIYILAVAFANWQ